MKRKSHIESALSTNSIYQFSSIDTFQRTGCQTSSERLEYHFKTEPHFKGVCRG